MSASLAEAMAQLAATLRMSDSARLPSVSPPAGAE
jgi:hypothetical protein